MNGDREAIIQEIRDTKRELGARIDTVNESLGARIDKVGDSLSGTQQEMAGLRVDMKRGREWVRDLNNQVDDQERGLGELRGVIDRVEQTQKECPARTRVLADATGQRPALDSQAAIQILEAAQAQPAQPRRSGLTLPPSIARHGKIIKLAGLGGAGGVAFLLLVIAAIGPRAVEILKALAQLLH